MRAISNIMNPFAKLTEDIFKDANFLESVTLSGVQMNCICCKSLESGISYTDAGLVDEEDFYLQIKKPTFTPKEGNIVNFRNKNYKVKSISIDSANSSMNVYLKSTSKG